MRRRYAITLAEFLQGNVSLHKLFRSICRIAVYSLQMAVDLKDRGRNRVEFLKSEPSFENRFGGTLERYSCVYEAPEGPRASHGMRA